MATNILDNTRLLMPPRGVVEHILGWITSRRRLVRDCERCLEVSGP